jgi:MFS family permease
MFKGTFLSLKVRNYRLYFIGQAISLCGTWMQTIAQDWLVLKITGSGTQLGIVSALQFLPVLLLGPWGGVIADRFDKRKIMYVTQTASGILALILAALVTTGSVRIWMVYILALGLGLANTINNPAQQTFVPEMVGEDHLKNAVTLNVTEVNLARAVGPTLAGIIIATLGIAACFWINGISYIAVLVVLAMMRQSELRPGKIVQRAKGQLSEGLRYVMRSPILLDTLVMLTIIGTFTYEFSVSLPLLAQYAFHGGAGSYSALVAATGVGSVVGGLFSASRKNVTSKMLIIAAAGFGITFSIAALMPTLLTAIIALFFVGVFSINFIAIGNTILQLESEPRMRGRVMALWSMAFLGSTPIGGPIIGWIGQYAGPRWAVGIGGIAAILAALIAKLALRKRTPIESLASRRRGS